MLNVGVTGGIAAGKSTVATILANCGGHLIDADAIAREVVAPQTPGLHAVIEAFGPGVIDESGELDRSELGRIVFGDDEARARLEGIIHPLVRARTVELQRSVAPGSVVIHDVPLIIEADLAVNYHLVIVASASERERLRRLADSRGMERDAALARMAAQATDDQRAAVADVLLNTEQSMTSLESEVERLWTSRLAPFAQNIARNERAARAPGSVVMQTPPRPPRTWPVQAQALLARINAAAGALVASADHIGSTSVPGLPAKDVIDLQLGVRDLGTADALDEPLRKAGFIRIAHIDSDTPKPHEPDPALWRKRLYASADPGRPVNLHVRQVGSPGWRYALAFRDWLRADAPARVEYLGAKERAAAATSSSGEYAESKEPWFTDAWPRLQQWTRHTNWDAPRS